MINSARLFHSFGAIAIVGLVLGCSGPQSPVSVPRPVGPSQQSRIRPPSPDHLLYAGNSNNTVTVYSGGDKLLATLTGFDQPAGLCIDRAGNIFIVNAGTSQIFEYAHGGTSPINTLTDPYGFPAACSVDSTTGNLAVTDASADGVLIYANASGTPTVYVTPTFLRPLFPGYDNQGNLFVDGERNPGQSPLAELPKGGSSLVVITPNQNLAFADGLQWDGKYLAICDNALRPNVIYQFSISGSNATLQGTTTLAGSQDIGEFWVPRFGNLNAQGTQVVAADFQANDVAYWNYPAGGTTIKTITNGIMSAGGVTISP